VLPKIYRSEIEDDEQQRNQYATRNLMYLLTYAAQVTIREQSVASLASQKLNWFDILTRIFARHLQDELKRGTYRTYQSVEDELPVLKGKWRVAEQSHHPEHMHCSVPRKLDSPIG
jgi:5-methylcytosine-specific restriction endonuclease McrBC regulatory subunit McrC